VSNRLIAARTFSRNFSHFPAHSARAADLPRAGLEEGGGGWGGEGLIKDLKR